MTDVMITAETEAPVRPLPESVVGPARSLPRQSRSVRRITWATISSAVFLGSFASAASSTSELAPAPVDYEAAFAKAFPSVGDEHRIVDWAFYVALMTNDAVAYAARVDPAVASEIERLKDKRYQTQQLQARIKADPRLLTAFDEQRRRIRSMVLFVDGRGLETEPCVRPLVYLASEFRLVLGESSGAGDPMSHATIAPACPTVLSARFQITAARSWRFSCWAGTYTTSCGWRLPDMPVDLKRVIENVYPVSMTLRWRWRGTAGVARTRYLDSNSNRVAARDSVALIVPSDLGLEFVDEGGHILWTATSAGPGKRSGQ